MISRTTLGRCRAIQPSTKNVPRAPKRSSASRSVGMLRSRRPAMCGQSSRETIASKALTWKCSSTSQVKKCAATVLRVLLPQLFANEARDVRNAVEVRNRSLVRLDLDLVAILEHGDESHGGKRVEYSAADQRCRIGQLRRRNSGKEFLEDVAPHNVPHLGLSAHAASPGYVVLPRRQMNGLLPARDSSSGHGRTASR